MTLETIVAFRDHDKVDRSAIRRDRDESEQVFEGLEQAGISMSAVTDQPTREGVEKFRVSLHALLDAIVQRRGSLVSA
jgi:hypothetical protein